MNKEQVRHWFGNRGYPLGANFKHQCVKNDWLFINQPKGESPEQVELYYLKSIYCEIHDEYALKNFDWKEESLNKIVEDIPFYKAENQFGYCLYAHSGDCIFEAIILNGKHIDVLEDYLRVESERTIQNAFHWKSGSDLVTEEARSLFDKHHTLGNKLIDLGVFHHKWHKRSSWILIEVDFDEDMKPSISAQYKTPKFVYQKET